MTHTPARWQKAARGGKAVRVLAVERCVHLKRAPLVFGVPRAPEFHKSLRSSCPAKLRRSDKHVWQPPHCRETFAIAPQPEPLRQPDCGRRPEEFFGPAADR